MWYNINFNKLAINYLPAFLRKPVILAVISSLLEPVLTDKETHEIKGINEEWKDYRETNIKSFEYNGQVCYLRKVLNDELDTDLRRLTVENALIYDRTYIYSSNLDEYTFEPLYIGGETDYINVDLELEREFIHSKDEYIGSAKSFVVKIPEDIYDKPRNIYQIDALVNTYRAASRKYKLEKVFNV